MLRHTLGAALLAASLAAAAQAPTPPQAPSAPPPPVAESLAMRAAARLQAGDIRGALADANAAIARDSRNSGAYALRGTIRMTSGDRTGAMLDMNRAIELAGDVKGIEVVFANRANLHWLDGRSREAAADIAAALHRNPDFALAL